MDKQPPHGPDADADDAEGPIEIPLTGDLTDNEGDLTERLLGVEPGEACTLYFDSPGGSPYCAMSLMTLIKMRRLRATGIVTGECSSAALWPFAACERRIVTPYSVLLFHPMRWQSEENVGLAEAAEWARHFGDLERCMDELLASMFGAPPELMSEWINPGRYVSGKEVADAGIAEMIQFDDLPSLTLSGPPAADRASASGAPAGRGKATRPAAAAKRGN
ncbi:MAG: ATP-dependent Clp protease proteolytic subunit [Planctomycetota bacterium]